MKVSTVHCFSKNDGLLEVKRADLILSVPSHSLHKFIDFKCAIHINISYKYTSDRPSESLFPLDFNSR